MFPWCWLWWKQLTNPAFVVGHNQVILQGNGRPTNFWTNSINDFDGIPINDASVPPPHEILQDGQVELTLHTTAKSQAAPTPVLPVPGENIGIPSFHVMPVPGRVDNKGELVNGLPVQDLTAAGQPWQNVGTYKDGPAKKFVCPSMGNHMISPSVLGSSTSASMLILFLLFWIEAVSLIITPIKNSSSVSLRNAIYYKSHGLPILLAWMQCLTTWLWILGPLLNTTSTIFPTHNYLQLAPHLLNITKIILPLTLSHVAHFRLNSGKQCTTSSQHSFKNSTPGTMFHTLLTWMSYQAFGHSK